MRSCRRRRVFCCNPEASAGKRAEVADVAWAARNSELPRELIHKTTVAGGQDSIQYLHDLSFFSLDAERMKKDLFFEVPRGGPLAAHAIPAKSPTSEAAYVGCSLNRPNSPRPEITTRPSSFQRRPGDARPRPAGGEPCRALFAYGPNLAGESLFPLWCE